MANSSTATKKIKDDIGLRDHDDFISQQIERTRRSVKINDFSVIVLSLAVGVISFLLLLILLDHWIVGLSNTARMISLALLVTGTICFSIWKLGPLILRSINPIYAAKTIEEATPGVRNSIVNFLFLRKQPDAVKEVVFQAVQRRAASDLSSVPIDTAVDRTLLIRLGYVLAALVVFAGLYKVFSPKDPMTSVSRVLSPWEDITRPSRVFLGQIQPGNDSIYSGEAVEVTAVVQGLGKQESVALVYSTDDGQAIDRLIEMDTDDGQTYRTTLGAPSGLYQDVIYRITAGDAVSLDYEITVNEAPNIMVRQVEYDFPAYTEQPDDATSKPDVSAIEGTKVTIRAEANQTIAAAYLELIAPTTETSESVTSRTTPKTKTLRMNHSEDKAYASFTLRLNPDRKTQNFTGYRVVFENDIGQKNRDPITHLIHVKADLAPLIDMLQPKKRDLEIAENRNATFEVRAVDPDFQLTNLFVEGVSGGTNILKASLLSAPQTGQVVRKYEFHPKKLGLRNGDIAIVWASAEDNRSLSGLAANTSRSEKYRLRIVEAVEETNPQDNRDPQSKDDPNSSESEDPQNAESKNNDSNSNDSESKDPNNAAEESSNNENAQGNQSSESTEDADNQSNDQGNEGQGQTGESDSKQESTEDNSDRGEPSGKQESDPSEKNAEQNRTQGGKRGSNPNQDETPLESDGSEDGEAIERILEDMKENGKDPGNQDSQNQEPANEQKNPNDQPDAKNPSDTNDPSESNSQREQDSANRDNNRKDKSQTPNSDSQDPNNQQKDSETANNQQPREDETPQDPSSDSNSGTDDQKQKDDSSSQNSNQSRSNDSAENRENSSEEKQPRDANPDQNPDAQKPADSNSESNSDSDPKNQNDSQQNSKSANNTKDADSESPKDNPSENSQPSEQARDPNQESKDPKRRPDDNSSASENESDQNTSDSQDQKSETPKESSETPSNRSNPSDQQTSRESKSKADQASQQKTGSQENSNSTGETADEIPPGTTQEDQANLEYAEKATEMALEHLRDQKDNRDLLEKLGWTEAEADSFIKRWEQMAKNAKKPDATGKRAKNDWKDALESLGLRPPTKGKLRKNVVRRNDSQSASDGSRRLPPPAAYKELQDAYLKETN